MQDKRKIKEIYNCNYIFSDEELYPLQRWYNKLIDKTINEITIADVLRMMRQKEFLDLAMAKAMEFLRDNVFAGETYEGELLEKISEMNTSFLSSYSDKLETILKNALDVKEMHEWSYDGEKEEFEEMINSLLKK
ncbi:MAG: contact-dependent growth inhibition system immunity protein [Lachnospiraceae bacterium]